LRVVQYQHATPLLVPSVGWNDVLVVGHGTWVNEMGHMGHGPQNMSHYHLCCVSTMHLQISLSVLVFLTV